MELWSCVRVKLHFCRFEIAKEHGRSSNNTHVHVLFLLHGCVGHMSCWRRETKSVVPSGPGWFQGCHSAHAGLEIRPPRPPYSPSVENEGCHLPSPWLTWKKGMGSEYLGNVVHYVCQSISFWKNGTHVESATTLQCCWNWIISSAWLLALLPNQVLLLGQGSRGKSPWWSRSISLPPWSCSCTLG